MNRRGFLKRTFGAAAGLAVLPKIGEAMPKRNIPEAPLKIFNGQIFIAPWPVCHVVSVLYFGRGDQWLLLSEPSPAAQHDGNAMMVCHYEHDGGYDPIYTQGQLQEKLKGWKLIGNKVLRLEEKIEYINL